jgi:hypothetical protein
MPVSGAAAGAPDLRQRNAGELVQLSLVSSKVAIVITR